MAFLSSPLLPAPYDLDSKLGAIPILRQQKDWVGESRIGPFLLMFSAVFMVIRWVGWVQKGQKYADVCNIGMAP